MKVTYIRIVDVASGKFIGTMASDAKTPDEITDEYRKSKYYKYLADDTTAVTSPQTDKQSTLL